LFVSKRLLGLMLVIGLAGTAMILAATTASGSSTTSATSGRDAKICIPKRTVGQGDIIAQSPIDFKSDQMGKLIAQKLGWTYKFSDAAGDPTKLNKIYQGFVTQKVDVIINTSGDASPIRSALLAAKRANIPVFEVNSGNQISPLQAGQYAEDETTMGKILAQYIVKTVKNARISDLTTKLTYAGGLRETALRKVVAGSGGKAKIVAANEVDLTNPVVNTTKIVTDHLTAHPDINAVFAVFDNMAAAAIQAVRSKGKAGSVGVYTYFTTPANLKYLRTNTPLKAVADANLPFGVVIAYDQFIQHEFKKKAIDKNALQKAGGLSYRIVDRKSVPKTGEVFSNAKTLAPYLKKWQKQFPC
jgi:ABC-type sugar transport system substrate-binding protein